MKKWLKNILIALPFLAKSLGGFSQNTDETFTEYLSDTNNWKSYEVNSGIKQPEYNSRDSVKKGKTISFKEVQKKLGIKYITELKNLGHGYITSKNEHDAIGSKNYNDLRIIQGIDNGSIIIKTNGKKWTLEGNLSGDPCEKILEEVDCIEKDRIITDEEVSNSLNAKYKNAFFDYASEKLEVPEDEIISVGHGYFTSKNLEGRLDNLGKNYENRFGRPRQTLYKYIGDDAVLTEEEIFLTEKTLNKYLHKQE